MNESHVPAPPARNGWIIRQVCVWCGVRLIEIDLLHTRQRLMPDGHWYYDLELYTWKDD